MSPARFMELEKLAADMLNATWYGPDTVDVARALAEALEALKREDIENHRLRSALRTLLDPTTV